MKYLKDDIDSTLHLFIERLMELAQIDGKSNDLLKIYNGHVNELASTHKNDLKFSRLLENVENKLRFLDESRNLEEIIINKDYDALKNIHEQLIHEHVGKNREKTIRDCFYNLKHEGIYSDNLANRLIEKGQIELENSNYDALVGIITKLYELDERVF